MACNCVVNGKSRTVEEANFRDFYHRFQFIECPDEIDTLRDELDIMEEATGLLTYSFVEEGRGLTFFILCSATIRDGEFIFGPDLTETMARTRYMDVIPYDFCDQDQLGLDLTKYDSLKKMIAETFETKDDFLQKVYDLELLDGNRNVEVPDYVSVVVQREDLYPEYVWTKVTGFGREEIYGEILSAPKQDYGLKDGERIVFQMLDYDGKIYMIWQPDLKA